MSEGKRVCPLCEEETDAEVCPEHGCPTVECSLFEEQEEALKPGTVIAKRFEIVKLLGKGAMGSVFLGKQLSMSRQVAIKTLQRGLVKEQSMVKRFYLEARAASQLEHPNIVKIYDFGVDDETKIPYIAMEFIDGGTLDEHLPLGQGMPEQEACRLLSQVARGLVEAHGKGIVHRDLKPDNIYVRVLSDGEEQVKVLDFGIAKVVRGGTDSMRDLTQTGMTLGTPAFMAPEQIRAEEVDFRADLYSLGCILHQLLTGGGPFSGTENLSIMLRHLSESIPELPEALVDGAPPTEGLRRLHAALLQKAPADRPASTAGVAKAFKLLARGEALDADTVLAEVGAPVKRQRTHTITSESLAATGIASGTPVTGDDLVATGFAVGAPTTGDDLAATGLAEVPSTGDDLAAAGRVPASGFANTEAVADLADQPTPVETDKAIVGSEVVPEPPAAPSRLAPILFAAAAVLVIGVAVAWPAAEAPEPVASVPAPEQAPAATPAPAPAKPATPEPKAAAPAPKVEVVAEAPAVRPKKLTIVTKPPGATVLLPNGLQLQGVTPLTIDAPSDAMAITLVKDGFVKTEHTLDAGRTGEIRLTLEVDKAAKRARVKAKSKAKARSKAAREAKDPKAKKRKAPARKPTPTKRKKRSRPGIMR